ncbi:MAG: DsbA family protein [Halobacteriales archaeon]
MEISRRSLLATAGVGVAAGGGYLVGAGDGDGDGEGVDLGGHEPAVSPSFHTDEGTGYRDVSLGGKPIMGSPDADLELYYWMDFQCPFCERFERETLPDLYRDHVETGDVRVVLTTVPFFGEDSMTAAVASSCVWDSVREEDGSAYWNWHTAVMSQQGDRNSGWADAESLTAITEAVSGVDAGRVENCLSSERGERADVVRSEADKARSLGVSATPGFVVHNRDTGRSSSLSGAQPLELFERAIDDVS